MYNTGLDYSGVIPNTGKAAICQYNQSTISKQKEVEGNMSLKTAKKKNRCERNVELYIKSKEKLNLQ